jgi:hypothetical protein
MKYTLRKALPVIVFLSIFALPTFAQKSNPKIPIDGGLSILIAAGAGYGAKKLYNKKNKEN